MQAERNFSEYIGHQYRHGGITVRLIFINSLIFLVIKILEVIGRLLGESEMQALSDYAIYFFTLQTDFEEFIYHPWGLITSFFAHFSAWHFLMNMLFLYYAGKMFESFFDGRRLLATYVIGGIFGGLFELIAHAVFPTLQNEEMLVVGASGSIMALFSALAFYRPQMTVMLFGIFPIRLIFLAAFFILADVFALGIKDSTAHFAHVGGFLLGFLSVQGIGSNKNILNAAQMFTDKVIQFFKRIFSKSSHLRVSKKSKTRSTQFKSDEDYNLEAKQKQDRVDAILDKIAKSGYESLTNEEKKFLFNQSQR